MVVVVLVATVAIEAVAFVVLVSASVVGVSNGR